MTLPCIIYAHSVVAKTVTVCLSAETLKKRSPSPVIFFQTILPVLIPACASRKPTTKIPVVVKKYQLCKTDMTGLTASTCIQVFADKDHEPQGGGNVSSGVPRVLMPRQFPAKSQISPPDSTCIASFFKAFAAVYSRWKL